MTPTNKNKTKLLKEQYNEYKYGCISANVKYDNYQGWLRK